MSTILIIDDDRDIQSLIRLTVHSEGHEALLASGGEEGLQTIRSRTPDLVILDVMMPDMSGWNVLAELRKDSRTQRLPVIMLSALGETSTKIKGLRAGADDYLAKPFDPDELLARVEALLKRRPETRAGLQGKIEEHSVLEIAQGLGQNSRTGTFFIEGPDGVSRMVLEEGSVQLAEHGPLDGSDALLAMLHLREGEFRFESQSSSGDGSRKGLQLSSILMENAWLEDELAQRTDHLPPQDALLSLAGQTLEPPIPVELSHLPFDEILAEVHSNEPISLVDLIAAVPRAPIRVRLAVAWLRQEAYLLSTPEKTATGDRSIPEEAGALLDQLIAMQTHSGKDPRDRGILLFHSGEEEYIMHWVEEYAEAAGAGLERVLSTSGCRLILHGSDSSLSIHCRQLDEGAEVGKADLLAVVISLSDPDLAERRLAAMLSTVERTVSARSKLFLVHPGDASEALKAAAHRSESKWRIESKSTVPLTTIFEKILADSS